jgi:hypothetical protein
MAVVTSQQIQSYYDLYRSIEVTFNLEVTKLLGFVQDQVFLKVMGTQWPCILYSSSLDGAKVILSLKADQIEKLRKESNLGSLRYSFRLQDKTEPLTFFVNVKIKGYNRYTNATNPDLYFMTLEFPQRPSDDLIEILGGFLEANVNAHKRKDERIPVNEQIIHKIGFQSCNAIISVEQIDRKCLLRDLSFGGAKLIFPGVAKFLEKRPCVLRLLDFEDGHVISIGGAFLRVEPLEGHPDLTQAVMLFEPESVPQIYKVKINDFLKLLTKTIASKKNATSQKESS